MCSQVRAKEEKIDRKNKRERKRDSSILMALSEGRKGVYSNEEQCSHNPIIVGIPFQIFNNSPRY